MAYSKTTRAKSQQHMADLKMQLETKQQDLTLLKAQLDVILACAIASMAKGVYSDGEMEAFLRNIKSLLYDNVINMV